MESAPHTFRCIPLGVEGGLNESNLPAYLLAPIGSTDVVCLDAGEETREVVKRQLREQNDLGLHFIFAEQGKPFGL
jgi:3',5'-cyclic-nucleotide phosphodiesterase